MVARVILAGIVIVAFGTSCVSSRHPQVDRLSGPWSVEAEVNPSWNEECNCPFHQEHKYTLVKVDTLISTAAGYIVDDSYRIMCTNFNIRVEIPIEGYFFGSTTRLAAETAERQRQSGYVIFSVDDDNGLLTAKISGTIKVDGKEVWVSHDADNNKETLGIEQYPEPYPEPRTVQER